MGSTPAAGGVLGHHIGGQGEPLLLLNGGLMTIATWEPIAAGLRDRWKVVRCDFRGQLRSPGEPPPDFEGHVRDVLDLMDALGLERAHLAGTSFGSMVALRIAATRPERALSVAAIAGTDRVSDEVRDLVSAMREVATEAAAGGDGGRVLDLLLPHTYTPEYLEEQREMLEFHRQWTSALPAWIFRGLAAMLESVEDLDLRPWAADIRCPALVLAPELDRTFPLERSRALAAAIPGSRLEILAGAPHGLIVEQPAAVLAALRRFLSDLSKK
jgi:pimeloyl-ACP methyl ester carboxylesterase